MAGLWGCEAPKAVGPKAGTATIGPRLWRETGRPVVGVVSRIGAPALVAVLQVRDAEEALALEAWLGARLRREGVDGRFLRLDARSDALVVTIQPETAQLPQATRTLAMALLDRVDPKKDAEGLAEGQRRLAALDAKPATGPEAPWAHAACRGELVRRPGTSKGPLSLASTVEGFADALEAARRRASTRDAVAFGLSASTEAEAATLAVLRESGPWPSGPQTPAPPEPPREPARSAPGPARGLVVSLETTSPRAAAAARALAAPTSPLARLAAREGGTLAHVTATDHVDASCIDVSVTFPEPHDPLEPRVLPLLALVEATLTRALANADEPQADDPQESPDRAARHAAFFAASHGHVSRSLTTTRTLLAGATPAYYPLAAPGAPPPANAKIEARVSKTDDPWVLLAAPCAASDESSSDAGLAALVVTAAVATSQKASDQALLVPWFSPRGVGLVARGPALPNETPRAHLARLTALAASALAAPAPGPVRNAARARALAHASSDGSRLLSTLGETLAPGRLSMLVPTGSASSLARASDDALRARAIAIAEGPLFVHVVSPVAEPVARGVAQSVLSAYSLGLRADGACRIFTPRAPPTGRVDVVALAPRHGEDHVALAYVDEATRSHAILLAVAEAVRDGALAKELGERAHDLRVELAPFATTSALVVHFVSPREKTTDALVVARAFLAHAATRIPEDAFRRAVGSATAREGEADVALGWPPAKAVEPPPSSSPGAPPTVAMAEAKNAAEQLFASGGVVVVSGAP